MTSQISETINYEQNEQNGGGYVERKCEACGKAVHFWKYKDGRLSSTSYDGKSIGNNQFLCKSKSTCLGIVQSTTVKPVAAEVSTVSVNNNSKAEDAETLATVISIIRTKIKVRCDDCGEQLATTFVESLANFCAEHDGHLVKFGGKDIGTDEYLNQIPAIQVFEEKERRFRAKLAIRQAEEETIRTRVPFRLSNSLYQRAKALRKEEVALVAELENVEVTVQ